jgi:hypothetical protein
MIHSYFHCAQLPGWEALLEKAKKLPNLKINYASNLELEGFKERYSLITNFEHPTLRWISEDVTNMRDSDLVIYCHTKGLSSASAFNNGPWKDYLFHNIVNKYDLNCRKLLQSDCDTAGVLFTECKDGTSIFYAGNFWIAKASYLKKLGSYDEWLNNYPHKDPYAQRYAAESWLGSKNMKPLKLDNQTFNTGRLTELQNYVLNWVKNGSN